jgi:plastocyanin
MGTEKRKSRSRNMAIIAAIAAGVSIAVAAGLIINATLPRNTFSVNVINPPLSADIIIPAGASDPNGNATFTPREATVVLGLNNTVVWLNQNNNPETIVGSGNLPGDFGKVRNLIQPGESWAYTFTEEGTYHYFSDIHPWLQGTVVVKSMQDQDVLIYRERLVMTIALSHPEVEKELDSVLAYDIDYEWRENNVDHVTLTTYGSRVVEPLYSDHNDSFDRQYQFDIVRIDVSELENATGYKETFRENKAIQVDVDRRTNEIISIRMEPVPDKIVTTGFTDGQKKALSVALSDNDVRSIISSNQFFLASIRETGVGFGEGCGENECSLVGLVLASSEHLGIHTAVILNAETGEVVDLRSGN